MQGLGRVYGCDFISNTFVDPHVRVRLGPWKVGMVAMATCGEGEGGSGGAA